jgi:hypothetical protein
MLSAAPTTPIAITPDFEHPFELHLPDYEEIFDPEENAIKIALVAGRGFKTRWRKVRNQERTLEDTVRISARTSEVLLALGMDLEQDKREQEEWVAKYPFKTHKQEIRRLPPGMDPIDIFKLIHVAYRNETLVNMPKHHNVAEGFFREKVNERGEVTSEPLLGVDITVAGRRLRPMRTGSQRNRLQTKTPGMVGAALPPPDIYTSAVGTKLAAILSEYDRQIVKDAGQLRTYITNKLLEISSAGNPKDALRALELLGKISDVGLFVEKSEVNIVHTNAAALEHSIKDKINRLLGRANVEIEDGEFRPLPAHVLPAASRVVDE